VLRNICARALAVSAAFLHKLSWMMCRTFGL